MDHRVDASRPAGRPKHRWVLPILSLVIMSVSACVGTGGVVQPAGAASSSVATGPTPLVTRTLPTLAPRVSTSSATAPATAARLQPLVDRITAALAGEGRVPPNVKVGQKAAAGEQVIVFWIVNTDPMDAKAKQNVRTDAIKIMTVVKASNLQYGSVLLAATGTIMVDKKKKVTRVVRAKYTQALVRRTNWPAVSPAAIFTLCDDKPAIISPTFR